MLPFCFHFGVHHKEQSNFSKTALSVVMFYTKRIVFHRRIRSYFCYKMMVLRTKVICSWANDIIISTLFLTCKFFESTFFKS